jgi:hypothetical protein
MYWKTKDGRIREPEDCATILTLDFRAVMGYTEKEGNKYRMRDTIIEYGLKAKLDTLMLEQEVSKALRTKREELGNEAFYKLFGLWVSGLVQMNGKNKHEPLITNEEGEQEIPMPPEDPAVVESKRRRYCT